MKLTKILKRAVILLALVSITPAISASERHKKGFENRQFPLPFHSPSVFRILNDPQMVKDLNLTEAQVKKISDYDFASREKQLKLKSELDSLSLQMAKAFSDDPKDKNTILVLAKKISDIQGQLFVQRIETKMDVLKVLNDDQLSKIKTHRIGFAR